jgi:hypothetical protein
MQGLLVHQDAPYVEWVNSLPLVDLHAPLVITTIPLQVQEKHLLLIALYVFRVYHGRSLVQHLVLHV